MDFVVCPYDQEQVTVVEFRPLTASLASCPRCGRFYELRDDGLSEIPAPGMSG